LSQTIRPIKSYLPHVNAESITVIEGTNYFVLNGENLTGDL